MIRDGHRLTKSENPIPEWGAGECPARHHRSQAAHIGLAVGATGRRGIEHADFRQYSIDKGD